MSYSVDSSNEWQFVEGVETIVYTPPGGTTVSTGKARRGNITVSDLQSGLVGLSPGDVVLVIWLSTIGGADALAKEATIEIGTVRYHVVNWLQRADDAQARVFVRRGR